MPSGISLFGFYGWTVGTTAPSFGTGDSGMHPEAGWGFPETHVRTLALAFSMICTEPSLKMSRSRKTG